MAWGAGQARLCGVCSSSWRRGPLLAGYAPHAPTPTPTQPDHTLTSQHLWRRPVRHAGAAVRRLPHRHLPSGEWGCAAWACEGAGLRCCELLCAAVVHPAAPLRPPRTLRPASRRRPPTAPDCRLAACRWCCCPTAAWPCLRASCWSSTAALGTRSQRSSTTPAAPARPGPTRRPVRMMEGGSLASAAAELSSPVHASAPCPHPGLRRLELMSFRCPARAQAWAWCCPSPPPGPRWSSWRRAAPPRTAPGRRRPPPRRRRCWGAPAQPGGLLAPACLRAARGRGLTPVHQPLPPRQVIDLTSSGASWRSVASMPQSRIMGDGIILCDGSVGFFNGAGVGVAVRGWAVPLWGWHKSVCGSAQRGLLCICIYIGSACSEGDGSPPLKTPVAPTTPSAGLGQAVADCDFQGRQHLVGGSAALGTWRPLPRLRPASASRHMAALLANPPPPCPPLRRLQGLPQPVQQGG